MLPSELQRKLSLANVKEKGTARLEEELHKAQKVCVVLVVMVTLVVILQGSVGVCCVILVVTGMCDHGDIGCYIIRLRRCVLCYTGCHGDIGYYGKS